MRRLEPLTAATAVGASRELLGELEDRHGQVGEMVRTMAHSPAVLGGYLQLSRATKRAKLDRKISERISIAIQSQLGCSMCLNAHLDAARGLGLEDIEIVHARRGTSGDAAIAAMVGYGLRVYRDPTAVTDEQIAVLRHYGYRDREIADVAGIVALNVLTGGFNLAAGLSEPVGQDARSEAPADPAARRERSTWTPSPAQDQTVPPPDTNTDADTATGSVDNERTPSR